MSRNSLQKETTLLWDKVKELGFIKDGDVMRAEDFIRNGFKD